MTDNPTVGILSMGEPTADQQAVEAALAAAGTDTSIIQPEVVSKSGLDVTDIEEADTDLIWWHRCESLDRIPATLRDALVSYVNAGSSLVLGRAVLSAITDLGIERTAPDGETDSSTSPATGFLIETLYRNHPLFEGFDDLRVEVSQPATPNGERWYETRAPQDGDVLAASVEGDTDRPSRLAVCRWAVGDGTVLGIGRGLSIAADIDGFESRTMFLSNVVEYLTDDRVPEPTLGRPKGRTEFEAMRDRLPDEQHRPRYHFTPPANWLNDPNGVVKWNGRYHLFYQYNPTGPTHNTIHWGHAVSDNLIDWTDEPLALTPTPGGPDEQGCWSGCFIDDDGTPTLIYTGGSGRDQLPCLATSDDPDLREWEKYDGNPIIENVPNDEDILSSVDWAAEFRDHSVWRVDDEKRPVDETVAVDGGTASDDSWRQLIGSGIDGIGGTALLYSSDDLRDWEYEGRFLVGDWRRTGPIWECPELLSFDTTDLLHVSDYSTVRYFRGKYDDGQFEPETIGQLDYGSFYAPQSLTDEERTVMFGWLKEDRDWHAQWDAGWSGAMSLPRRLSTTDAGSIQVDPVAEVERLRGRNHQLTDLTVVPDDGNPLTVEGDTLEIDIEFDPGDVREFGLVLRKSPDGREQTPIVVHPRQRRVIVERAQSSLDSAANETREWMPIKRTDDGTFRMRVFLDRSVVEVFANESQCLTSRIYPVLPESVGVDLVVRGGTATIKSLDIWELDLDSTNDQTMSSTERHEITHR